MVTTLLAVPVLVLSMAPGLQFRNWQWLCFVLAAPVAVWGAWPFHVRAVRGLRHSTATMDTLVSLGVAASFSWSVYALFLGGAGDPGMRMPFSLVPSASDGVAHIYLEAAVGVPLFVLAGRFLEARARRGTGAALRSLAQLAAKEVAVREDGSERLISIGELSVGHVFVVRPGERVATDGEVAEGSSAVDLSLVTGETEPVEVGPGSAVVGGAVNSGGLLLVRATAVGADTQLARITRLVTEAQAGKARAQRLADSVAGVFVPVVLALAVTTLGFWLGAGADPQAAITACGRPRRRMSLRPRPGDADRPDGRDRPGRSTGCPCHRPAGSGGSPAHRHRRPRQDRHAHLRPYERRPGHLRAGRARPR